MNGEYALIDSGNGRKLERFGPFVLSRPCATAVWLPDLPAHEWDKADAVFDRDGGNSWTFSEKIPDSWVIHAGSLKFKLSLTAFGHTGIFPEQIGTWDWLTKSIQNSSRSEISVLNLFAYSGGATLAAAQGGAKVCHLDASKGMTQRARENAGINGLENAPVRWIVDDVMKFLDREIRRGTRYDGIVLDPPSFGRGKSSEIFKIEDSVVDMLKKCSRLLSGNPMFVMFSCHTPAFTPAVLRNLISQNIRASGGVIEDGELFLSGRSSAMPVPSGTYAIWHATGVKGLQR